MKGLKYFALIAGATALAIPSAATAQRTEGDARSALYQYGRMQAPAGTFWLDGKDDREIVRYTTSRDVSICLPEPEGVGAADKGYPLMVTWDSSNTATLYPGNCLYFDASRVSITPATALPSNVVLTGQFNVSR